MDVDVGELVRRDGIEDGQAVGAGRRRGEIGDGVGHGGVVGLEPLGEHLAPLQGLAVRSFDANFRLSGRLEDDADRLIRLRQRLREPASLTLGSPA